MKQTILLIAAVTSITASYGDGAGGLRSCARPGLPFPSFPSRGCFAARGRGPALGPQSVRLRFLPVPLPEMDPVRRAGRYRWGCAGCSTPWPGIGPTARTGWPCRRPASLSLPCSHSGDLTGISSCSIASASAWTCTIPARNSCPAFRCPGRFAIAIWTGSKCSGPGRAILLPGSGRRHGMAVRGTQDRRRPRRMAPAEYGAPAHGSGSLPLGALPAGSLLPPSRSQRVLQSVLQSAQGRAQGSGSPWFAPARGFVRFGLEPDPGRRPRLRVAASACFLADKAEFSTCPSEPDAAPPR